MVPRSRSSNKATSTGITHIIMGQIVSPMLMDSEVSATDGIIEVSAERFVGVAIAVYLSCLYQGFLNVVKFVALSFRPGLRSTSDITVALARNSLIRRNAVARLTSNSAAVAPCPRPPPCQTGASPDSLKSVQSLIIGRPGMNRFCGIVNRQHRSAGICTKSD